MPVLRIPIVGSLVNRNINTLAAAVSPKDQLFINCYPELIKNPITGKNTAYLYKRPGSSATVALGSVTGDSVGISQWSGSSSTILPIAASFLVGGTSTAVWDIATATQIGSDIPNTSQCSAITETVVGVSTACLVGNFIDSATNATEQWFIQEGGAWTQVTDGNLPTNLVGFPAHMDGYVFNMTRDGRIVNTNLGSLSTYTATGFISAGQYPDKGVTVARQGQYIVAFGERSIERFYNAGNATGSPLSRSDGGAIAMGAAKRLGDGNLQTVLAAHSTIYWIGTNSDSAAIGIFRFGDKGAPEKISNSYADKFLMDGQIIGFAGTLVLHGMRHVALRMFGTSDSLVYCVDSGFWWRLQYAGGGAATGIAVCVGSQDANQLGASAATYFTAKHNARGNSFPVGTPVFQDATSTFTMTVQMQNIDLGTRRRKTWQAVSVIGDTQASASPLNISFSDDDYATFSAARSMEMSTQANRLTRWGASRRRAWKLTHATTTPLRLEAIEFEYELGYP